MSCVLAFLAVLQGGVSVPSVIVTDPGPGPTGRYLAAVLSRADTKILTGDSIVIAHDATFPGSVVAVARNVVDNGSVGGSLIVVGGDLFLRPNARVGGEAIAFGGAVYPSLLAQVRNRSASYRDFTFFAEDVNGTIELRYHELNAPAPDHPVVPLPDWLTTTIPTYDRSDGVSVSLGPSVSGGNFSATPPGTSRAPAGVVDPSATVSWLAARRLRVDVFGGREKRSNERWITSDFTNSLNTLFAGHDTRNYYRADAADLTVRRMVELPSVILEPRLGFRYEDASSARPALPPFSHPWSITDRNDPADEMRRPNPQIPRSRMTSAVLGTTADRPGDRARAKRDTWVEIPFSIDSAGRFTQATLDGQIIVPTFGAQRFRFDVHGVLTAGDTAPRQRWAYLGGSGTLSTMDSLLTMGGGELLFMEGRYIVPIEQLDRKSTRL